MSASTIKLLIACAIPLLVWLLPLAWIPLPGYDVLQHRVLVAFVFAVVFWIMEPIPIYATSVLIITLLLLVASDGGLNAMAASLGEATPLSYQKLLGSFAEPIIMLFLGGFFLAMAATKYQLDTNLARVLLKPFGNKPGAVLLGLMAVTAVFSMFMSNTATTAMMLAVLMPVLGSLPPADRGRTAFILGVPMAANVGGIGTPIGTPPNAVAMKYLTGEEAISFVGWMAFAVPYVIVLLLITWLLLLALYKPQIKELDIAIEGRWQRSRAAIVVYVIFAATVLLWLTGPLHGITSHVVAMLPVALFSASGIINAKDLKKLSWDVLWLVASGFGLGYALSASGLSANFVAALPLETLSLPMLIVAIGIISTLMATFMSNTATANLLLPILAVIGGSMADDGDATDGNGATMLIIAGAIAASMGMALPVSTPPNAMAHASGLCTSRQMAQVGSLVAVVGLLLLFLLLWIMQLLGAWA